MSKYICASNLLVYESISYMAYTYIDTNTFEIKGHRYFTQIKHQRTIILSRTQKIILSKLIWIDSRWTLLDPAFDSRYFLDFLLELFQIRILLDDILFHHVIQIVQETNESEIGPRQSTADEVTAVLLHLSVQTFQIKRHRFFSSFKFLLFSLFITLIEESSDIYTKKR